MISKLVVHGLRGFAKEHTIEFAVANGIQNLGMTILVGPNNSGKSTIIEAIRALCQGEAPSFSQGRRNVSAGDEIKLTLQTDAGKRVHLVSLRAGASESRFTDQKEGNLAANVLVLPARRTFEPYFGRGLSNRLAYMRQIGFQDARSSQLQQFSARLFQIERNRAAFDKLLEEVVGAPLKWSIDLSDQGQYFLKFSTQAGGTHSSEGMGEGLISLLYIIDALYDSEPGHTIVIDEPELSLHPQYQKSLLKVLLRFAADRQIIVATHSPYFVDMATLARGAKIRRVVRGKEGTEVHALSDATSANLSRLLSNDNNPHVMGVNAREALFSGEGIVLLEGQEDVIFLDKALLDVGLQLDAYRFGWGVGGAGNMKIVAQMLFELGFRKVVGLLDNDMVSLRDALRKSHPMFHFDCIPAKDIRTKPAAQAREIVRGLLDDENAKVREKHRDTFKAVINDANAYLKA